MSISKKQKLREIQQEILDQRKLVRRKQNKPSSVPAMIPTKPGYIKNMELAELKLGVDLHKMLFTMTEQAAAEIIGVNKWTIHRWKNILRRTDGAKP